MTNRADSNADDSANDSQSPRDRAVVDFYKPHAYVVDESIGYMMKRILAALSQTVETSICEPGQPTYPQWMPLHKLHVGNVNTVAELARECGLDAGAMTRLLDRLEAKNLCRRVRSVADRRVVNIELTDEGRAAAQEVPSILARVQNEYLAGFSVEEWEQLKGYLRRILENAQVINARGEKQE
ncbi:MarR family transcriptional regulator [Variovorax dokdonensis]|uniref:MarR family transcriptional regulator n=1 Tax=Variovorax dokdonensis TaxID=344883 RepID=A0ABT7NEN1_9BURK|nr:MarR family transcriptional regulator [Variovorax dokdonensis]MDM0046411.1 MarR family transcriptional regulator [Variovorax dokdonensis]